MTPRKFLHMRINLQNKKYFSNWIRSPDGLESWNNKNTNRLTLHLNKCEAYAKPTEMFPSLTIWVQFLLQRTRFKSKFPVALCKDKKEQLQSKLHGSGTFNIWIFI